MRQTLPILLFSLLIIWVNDASCQLASWDFTGQSGVPNATKLQGSDDCACLSGAPQASLGQSTPTTPRQSGFPSSGGCSVAWAVNFWNTSGSAVSTEFMQFSMTVDAGINVEVDGIQVQGRSTGTGPANYIVCYSTNGFSSETCGTSGTTPSSCGSLNVPNISSAISLSAGQTFAFRVYGYNAPSTSTGTLALDNISINGTLLPVEMASFNAETTSKGGVQLVWETASETNNDYFDIQHSQNGKDFNTIKTINGAGTTTTPQYYSWIDPNPIPGTNYYRLKQVDFDRRFQFSEVKAVEVISPNGLSIANNQFNIYPNPASNDLYLNPIRTFDQPVSFDIVNMLGRSVLSGKMDGSKSANSHINIEQLQAGSYLIRLSAPNHRVLQIARFIKSN